MKEDMDKQAIPEICRLILNTDNFLRFEIRFQEESPDTRESFVLESLFRERTERLASK
jgi:hypothetical protein